LYETQLCFRRKLNLTFSTAALELLLQYDVKRERLQRKLYFCQFSGSRRCQKQLPSPLCQHSPGPAEGGRELRWVTGGTDTPGHSPDFVKTQQVPQLVRNRGG